MCPGTPKSVESTSWETAEHTQAMPHLCKGQVGVNDGSELHIRHLFQPYRVIPWAFFRSERHATSSNKAHFDKLVIVSIRAKKTRCRNCSAQRAASLQRCQPEWHSRTWLLLCLGSRKQSFARSRKASVTWRRVQGVQVSQTLYNAPYVKLGRCW